MKYICVEGFLSVFIYEVCRMAELSPIRGKAADEVSVVLSLYTSLRLRGFKSVGEKRFTLPMGCFHSLLEGGRTRSASGMCANTRNPDHVMA